MDDEDFYEGDVHLGFVLNGRYNAGGICWDSNAKLSDGLFNLLILESRSVFTALQDSSRIVLGQWDKVKGTRRACGKKVEVTLQESVAKTHPLFEIDGDLLEDDRTRGASFEVIPGGILFQQLIQLS